MDLGRSKTILLVIMIFTNLLGCAVANFQPARQLVDMRAIDWEKFVENDSHLQHPLSRDQDYDRLQDYYGPYIEIPVEGWKSPISGHVLSNQFFL